MGAKAYTLINQLGIEGAVVEIGSERSEGSTTYLNGFCENSGNPFYSVDVNHDQYLNALKITKGKGCYNMTGEEFLGSIFPLLGQQIGFAYLDNFDLVTTDGRDWTQRKMLYQTQGLEMTNINSKIAHMTQSLLVERAGAKPCYILFDDTWIDDQTKEFEGKGAWAIRPLIHAHFKIQNEVFVGNEVDGLKHGYILLKRENE